MRVRAAFRFNDDIDVDDPFVEVVLTPGQETIEEVSIYTNSRQHVTSGERFEPNYCLELKGSFTGANQAEFKKHMDIATAVKKMRALEKSLTAARLFVEGQTKAKMQWVDEQGRMVFLLSTKELKDDSEG